jgi:hypothetical protein
MEAASVFEAVFVFKAKYLLPEFKLFAAIAAASHYSYAHTFVDSNSVKERN